MCVRHLVMLRLLENLSDVLLLIFFPSTWQSHLGHLFPPVGFVGRKVQTLPWAGGEFLGCVCAALVVTEPLTRGSCLSLGRSLQWVPTSFWGSLGSCDKLSQEPEPEPSAEASPAANHPPLSLLLLQQV